METMIVTGGAGFIGSNFVRTELGWQPRHDFRTELRRTVAWYFERRDWCETVLSPRHDRERLVLGSQEIRP